jgi:hypothetical protein
MHRYAAHMQCCAAHMQYCVANLQYCVAYMQCYAAGMQVKLRIMLTHLSWIWIMANLTNYLEEYVH